MENKINTNNAVENNAEKGKWKLEINDFRAVITVINVLLIMIFGLQISWFGLAVASLGLLKDIFIDKKINGSVMHLSSIVLNCYFLMIYYGVI